MSLKRQLKGYSPQWKQDAERAKMDTASEEGEEDVINLATPSLEPGEDTTGMDDPEAVRLMIHYLYHDDYNVEPKMISKGDGPTATVHEDDRTLSTHAKVYAAAVKYGIAGLQKLAQAYFLGAIAETRRDQYSFDDVAETIRTVYTCCPDYFKDFRQVLSFYVLNRRALVDDVRVMDAIESTKGTWQALLRDANTMLVERPETQKHQENEWASSVGY
ncbi:hypothetical protein LTR15_004336 [Elasticomyces elasticus]|nr:hypothetical protein LTR15_004336 [Elasticomyces elasticus]